MGLAKQQTSNGRPNGNGANLGFEQKLWMAADKLRNNMDAAEYKHVVLGLIFLKYISDAFTEVYTELKKDPLADAEDIDEYKARNAFWVPPNSRWSYLQKNAKQPTIGKIVDEAMDAIERDNPQLKGVLPKNYAREGLDKQRLGELIDLIGTIGLGDRESRSKDILGRVYEYFLGQFADAEGKKGGQFYTPQSIVRLLVAMIEPFRGRVFDPCCGSGGMFVQSEKFVEAHRDTKPPSTNGERLRREDLSIYGQESNQTTWRLCKMNLAIRHIDSKFVVWNNEGSFLHDAHPDLKADYLLANPPFNDSDWKGEMLREDARWQFGVPPVGNANFAWVQHFIHH
ncbi:MAG: type I restriction-modification system subunit M, partial [Candidatus Bathyarchaeota archaeon]|nr:type I restriction-modification system subunit M [Candidatus Bathyarchaeota archaeon]